MPARKRVGIIGLAFTLTAVLAIIVNPTTVDSGHESTITRVLAFLHKVGVPHSYGYAHLEFTANIIMFLPLGFFAVLLTPRKPWVPILALPALSGLFEAIQLLFLPGRFATISDVIANTLGAALGVGIGYVFLVQSAVPHEPKSEFVTEERV